MDNQSPANRSPDRNRIRDTAGQDQVRATPANPNRRRWLVGAIAGVALVPTIFLAQILPEQSTAILSFSGTSVLIGVGVAGMAQLLARSPTLAHALSVGGALFLLAYGLFAWWRALAAPGRPERDTELALRFAPVTLRRSLHGADPALPETVALTLVDVRETSALAAGQPIVALTADVPRMLPTVRICVFGANAVGATPSRA